MFELELSHAVLLILCLLAACAFEFVNGFHDTANAVATVIYTNSLKPWTAVILSGICNFVGVLIGGVGVAVGIINLLPVESLVDQDISHGISMIMALLISAISWNLFTWYFGIPCSSSHTLIGSILGVGIAYSLLPGADEAAVNWGKAQDIGVSLLISPLFGFSMTIILMFIIRNFTKKTKYADILFKEPKKNAKPPLLVRSILILTCGSVSLTHGSNDGQKGVGLVMLILIGIVPAYFSLNTKTDPTSLLEPVKKLELLLTQTDAEPLSQHDQVKLTETITLTRDLHARLSNVPSVESIPAKERFEVRKDILLIDRHVKDLVNISEAKFSNHDKKVIEDEMKQIKGITDYSPYWVILMIAFSLGTGTMIGWKRIVKTIGEKIGKEHLTYAQGASAEIIAASTIGVSTYFSLPVSTTHVLSSGIAGSMVATKGVKNLQSSTIKNILMAWLLTLPVVLILSGGLFLIFRSLF
jgi:phosphate/sulfate permease